MFRNALGARLHSVIIFLWQQSRRHIVFLHRSQESLLAQSNWTVVLILYDAVPHRD